MPSARGAGPGGRGLPVVVLAGFLGAGKTSVLNHLLNAAVSWPGGLRIAAVVNDFGDIEVDAAAVADRVDSLVSLAGGCLCCEVDASELTEALGTLAGPEYEIDLVVIEASGLAEPTVLSRMVMSAPAERVQYAGTIQVVDALHIDKTLERHPRLAVHLAEADLVVVNKCDLVSREGWESVRSVVRQHAAAVAVIPAVRGAIPAGLVLGIEPGPAQAAHTHCEPGSCSQSEGASGHPGRGQCEHGAHEHLHDGYSAVTARALGPLHPRRFLAAMGALPAGVYRSKGALTLATAEGCRRYRVATVGRKLELEVLGVDEPGYPELDGLVLIGVDLPADAEQFLDSAVVRAGEQVDSGALLGLHPHLVADSAATEVEEWIYDEQRTWPLSGAAAGLTDPEDPDTMDPAFTP